jgi:hypothetical protein
LERLRVGLALAIAALCSGWDYVEHASLGAESYRHACEQLRSEISSSAEQAIRTRLDIACNNLDIAAQLYGQATALAGDRFGGPADFLSTRAGWKAASRKHYYSLALANTTHFHPYTTREWWRYHRQALVHAVEASKKLGLDAVDALQIALFESAFADHFLHDAFSAGHMGFNRAASSAAASLVYHDQWNGKGRVIRDRAGTSWKTYGDGHLDIKANADGRAHVVTVATLSVGGVLRAFVLGNRDPTPELEIWRALPFVIDAPETPSLTDDVLGVTTDGNAALHPLDAINWPARKDRVVDMTTLVTGTFHRTAPTVAVLIGYHVSLPLVSVPMHVGVGATLPIGDRDAHFAGHIGITAPLGLTNAGLFDHHLSAGVMWEARYSTIEGSVWAGYLMNIELGRNLVQLQVGPAFIAPANEIGFAATLGVARVLSAAGGGVR